MRPLRLHFGAQLTKEISEEFFDWSGQMSSLGIEWRIPQIIVVRKHLKIWACYRGSLLVGSPGQRDVR